MSSRSSPPATAISRIRSPPKASAPKPSGGGAVSSRRVISPGGSVAVHCCHSEDTTAVALIDALIDLTSYNATTPGLVAVFAVLSGEATAVDHPGHGYFRQRYARVREITEEAVVEGRRGATYGSSSTPPRCPAR